jgi:uncharacterized protein (DUF2252 family)
MAASTRAADVLSRIAAHNAGREPERLRMKYAKMASDPFIFFRGSCHLFYDDWPDRHALDDAPLAWISGDLHLENFGSYRGANRLVYFDITDFDEAALAPASWEAARCATSLLLAAADLRLDPPSERMVRALCGLADALVKGQGTGSSARPRPAWCASCCGRCASAAVPTSSPAASSACAPRSGCA